MNNCLIIKAADSDKFSVYDITRAEDANGQVTKESIKKLIDRDSDDFKTIFKDFDPYIDIEVPYASALDALTTDDNKDLSDYIYDNDLYNIFDDFPVSTTARVPLEYLTEFYENAVLTDNDYASGEDIRLSKWLLSEYTLDETEDMLRWMAYMHPDFDPAKTIVNKDIVNDIREYLEENHGFVWQDRNEQDEPEIGD